MRSAWIWGGSLGVTFTLALFGACEDDPPGPGDGTGGGGGTGGCPTDVTANYELVVTTLAGDPLPSDLRMSVYWSGNDEPEFVLADTSTHMTLEDGSNVVCHVDEQQLPDEVVELRCDLWTSGPTQVVIAADGYLDVDETFPPEFIDGCEDQVPSAVSVELELDVDAGPEE